VVQAQVSSGAAFSFDVTIVSPLFWPPFKEEPVVLHPSVSVYASQPLILLLSTITLDLSRPLADYRS
jgi:hypothetical protein